MNRFDILNLMIVIVLLVNIILSSIYFHNMRNKENYEYGINLYRSSVNKQYSQFCKNTPN